MNKTPNSNQVPTINTRNINTQPIQSTNTRNTTPSRNTSSGYTSYNVVGIVLLIFIILLIIGASYWAYTVYSARTFQTSISVEALPDVKNASSKFEIGSGSIPNSKYSNEYSISMWLNILDYNYNYGKEKIILRRGTTGSSNLEIILADKQNDLIVRIKQQGQTPSTAMTLSKFANIEPQNNQYNINDNININTRYTHGTTGNPFNNQKNNKVFDKISGNQIDYQTITYDISSGCDNALNTLKPEDAMSIMIKQAIGIKEGFNNTYYNENKLQLGNLDTSKIADNSAPLESQVIHKEYFNLVSGNNIISNIKKERYSNTPSINKTTEKFDSTTDLVNAFTAVMIDICNIAKELQKQSTADNTINAINEVYKKIIDNLELARNQKITPNTDANLIISNVFENLNGNINITSDLDNLFEQLKTNNELLENLSDTINVDFTLLQTEVNAKLANTNCSLTIDGTTELDASINLYQNLLNLLRKSLYTYINNLGSGINKTYTDIKQQQSTNCLLDENINTDPTIGTCVYKMIPLQKWVHVIISVYNQVVDIYIDGQLTSSCVLKGFPAISTDDVNITPDGGFSGQISRVTFSNTAMTVSKAKSLYYDGPVPTTSIFSMIPRWVWYGIIFLIAIAILYSILT
jgi:hypothetical protein